MSVATFAPKVAIPKWFVTCLTDYLASWRQKLDDATVGRAYWDTLSDCSQGDIEAAGLELRRAAGGEFPPSAARWHDAALKIGRERRLRDTLVLSREQYWREECEPCHDTGWQLHDCTITDRCGRRLCQEAVEAHTHSYATVCPCRATNSTYQRARERERTSKRSDAGEAQPRRSGGGSWTKASEAR